MCEDLMLIFLSKRIRFLDKMDKAELATKGMAAKLQVCIVVCLLCVCVFFFFFLFFFVLS
jgi:hypothetical protein